LSQGELFEVLEDDKCLPEEQVQAIAKQLVYMHFTLISVFFAYAP
jgi:predicted signal transduction protein with EAL and GGDEF domain